MLVVFGAVPIVYQIKLYAKRYRTRKMFEQDFANQIKMTGKPGDELQALSGVTSGLVKM